MLWLMARGLGNTEIAEKLFVSEATVKTHVAHILDKLQVENRVQAVVQHKSPGPSLHPPRHSGRAEVAPSLT